VAPSALHTLFSSATCWWRAYILSESGMDSYTEVVPAPPAVVTREVRGERWRPAKAPAGPADRH
jgi:hypothetical protein